MRISALLVAAGITVASLSYTPAAQANVDQLVASMCDYVINDEKNRLRKKLKDARVKLRAIYDGVTCNGNSLVRTAMINNAQDVGVFLVKQLPRNTLNTAEADGQTLLQWAESQGHGASAIAAEITSRANE
ncbi:DUF3718 domain-containing protein [Ferrimonas balearica]|uniref:DUF3718 domain-containing protein n=1 Tax=Ferrimonas balearica TaxID=44012 RepID=UPI001C9A0F71|nr:DUF3718 domain-containing protein [Ferrimonas balearica]MBY5993024.1 DUF3718 domain-containing protein [Ferrimonas balearica]